MMNRGVAILGAAKLVAGREAWANDSVAPSMPLIRKTFLVKSTISELSGECQIHGLVKKYLALAGTGTIMRTISNIAMPYVIAVATDNFIKTRTSTGSTLLS